MEGAVLNMQIELSTREGCEMHAIRYARDDRFTAENVAWPHSRGRMGAHELRLLNKPHIDIKLFFNRKT